MIAIHTRERKDRQEVFYLREKLGNIELQRKHFF